MARRLHDPKRTLLSARPVGAAALRSSLALTVLLLAALAPAASAHGVAKPDEDVRLLQDWNDDCGGDGAAVQGGCRGSNDLIALDLVERADPAGDLAVFRLFMDRGQSGTHDIAVSLATPAGAKGYGLRTTDDSRFTGTGFLSVSEARPVLRDGSPDGTRFYVDAAVRLADLGGPGAKLSGFKVEAKHDGEVGDFMPGGCNRAIGTCVHNSGHDQDGGNFIRPDYTLRGPTYYASLGSPGAQAVAVGAETLVQVEVENELRGTPQALTLSVAGANGLTARFHDPASPTGEGYSETYRIELDGGRSTFAHLALEGTRGGESGTLTLTVATDKGGRTQVSIPYTVEDASGTTSGGGPTTDGGGRGAPSPAAALAGLALLGAAHAARRRA
jgi:hypothetical protein